MTLLEHAMISLDRSRLALALLYLCSLRDPQLESLDHKPCPYFSILVNPCKLKLRNPNNIGGPKYPLWVPNWFVPARFFFLDLN